jgi:flagellar biogenesis protein FliO
MESNFGLTPTEIIFLVVALVVTIPLLIFARWIFKELKKETAAGRGPGQDNGPKQG